MVCIFVVRSECFCILQYLEDSIDSPPDKKKRVNFTNDREKQKKGHLYTFQKSLKGNNTAQAKPFRHDNSY